MNYNIKYNYIIIPNNNKYTPKKCLQSSVWMDFSGSLYEEQKLKQEFNSAHVKLNAIFEPGLTKKNPKNKN